MAKINQQTLVITVSQLLRDDETVVPLLNDEIVSSIEAVVQQLTTEVSQNQVLVEVQRA